MPFSSDIACAEAASSNITFTASKELGLIFVVTARENMSVLPSPVLWMTAAGTWNRVRGGM